MVGVLSASLREENGVLKDDLEASDLLLADGETPRRGITRDHSRVQFLNENSLKRRNDGQKKIVIFCAPNRPSFLKNIGNIKRKNELRDGIDAVALLVQIRTSLKNKKWATLAME